MSDSRRLVVLDPGLLASVQDLGRLGVGALGVSPSGAVDWYSARAANRLAGNADRCALIETTMNGATFEATHSMTLAVTGADAPLWIDGKRKHSWRSLSVGAGTRIAIGPSVSGVRSYLAVAGGIEIPEVLGSASTDVGGGFGGRRLAAGDALCVGASPSEAVEGLAYEPSSIPVLRPPLRLRALAGPDASRLGSAVIDALFESAFRGSARSSRQGLRLEGSAVGGGTSDSISAGVCAGCVQLPGDGSPIVLLAEHQTTGGYPVALCVITADIPLAAQVRPGDDVRFERVNRTDARDALAAAAARLRAVRAVPSAATQVADAAHLGRGFAEGASS